MEVLATGNRIQVAVNGHKTLDYTDPDPGLCRAGPIGLQLHWNEPGVEQEVRWRGLRLSENPGSDARLITVAGVS